MHIRVYVISFRLSWYMNVQNLKLVFCRQPLDKDFLTRNILDTQVTKEIYNVKDK